MSDAFYKFIDVMKEWITGVMIFLATVRTKIRVPGICTETEFAVRAGVGFDTLLGHGVRLIQGLFYYSNIAGNRLSSASGFKDVIISINRKRLALVIAIPWLIIALAFKDQLPVSCKHL